MFLTIPQEITVVNLCIELINNPTEIKLVCKLCLVILYLVCRDRRRNRTSGRWDGGVQAADTGVVARAAWLGARPAGGGRPPGFLCLITTLVLVPPVDYLHTSLIILLIMYELHNFKKKYQFVYLTLKFSWYFPFSRNIKTNIFP